MVMPAQPHVETLQRTRAHAHTHIFLPSLMQKHATRNHSQALTRERIIFRLKDSQTFLCLTSKNLIFFFLQCNTKQEPSQHQFQQQGPLHTHANVEHM